MTVSNLYATLSELKAFDTARGMDVISDAPDDAVLSAILDQVSRYVESPAGANTQFYPSIETRFYDSPASGRDVVLDGPLLEVISFLNGDGSTISSTQYILTNANKTPYWKISLKDNATIGWYAKSGSFEQALSLTGLWGYRKHYQQRGWVSIGTLGAAITDAAASTFTMNAGHAVTAGQIVKIDSEIFNIASVVLNTVTPNRHGDNGSTAATHLDDAPVYAWSVQEEIKLAVLETVLGINALRNGQASSGKVTITAAGMVIRPEEVPPMAQKIFEGYRSPL